MKEKLKILINKQISLAKKFEVVSKGTKDTEPTYAWKGKYTPWLLEPRHIALELGISVSQLERVILDQEDPELMELWNDYKQFKLEVMLYDEQFGQIRPQLAEFSLKLFDKNSSTMTDVIMKSPDQEIVELELKIKELEKLNDKD